MQKLANSHVVPMNASTRRRRPASAASTGRPVSAGVGRANRPRVDERFIADPDLWDPATPHDSYQQKRPTSAPVYKRSLVDDIIDDDYDINYDDYDISDDDYYCSYDDYYCSYDADDDDDYDCSCDDDTFSNEFVI